MSIQVVSTTDSKENVLALNSQMSTEKEVEQKQSASVQDDKSVQDETAEESETTEENLDESDSDSSNEDDEESSEEQKDGPKPKKSRGIQKRIAKFQQKLSAKDQEIEHWKQVALSGAGKPQEKAKPANVENSQTDVSAKPNPASFESHEEYVEALTDWKIEAKERAKESKAKEVQQKTEYQKQIDTHLSKVNEFKKSYSDFDDVVSDVDDIPLTHAIQDAILTSDDGPALMYELSKNRSELERINSLSPYAAAREIGKIEARLSKGSEKQETKTITKTKAPPPIDPIGSKGTAKIAKSLSDPNLSQAEYERMRDEQSAKRR